MSSFLSIGTKLIFLVLAISISSIAITTGLAYNFADTIIKDNFKESLKDESQTRGDTITSIIESRIEKLQEFSENKVLANAFDVLIPALNDVSFDRILDEQSPKLHHEFHLFQLNEFEAGIRDLQIINMRGKPIFSLNEKIDPTTYVKGNYKVTAPAVEFIQDIDKTRLMKISLPVYSENGNQDGVLIATMGSSVFDNILLNRFGLHDSGEVYLVNQNKMMISESIFLENAQFNQKVDTFAVSECLENGKNVEAADYTDYRDVDIFGYSYCKPDLGFVLLTEVDEVVILKPITELQNRIILVGISLIVIASIVTFVLSKRISNPILKLRNAAQELSSGNFDVRTNIKTNDEIEQLSASFDNMAKTLQESISAIGKRENIIKQQGNILEKFFEEKRDSYVCLVDLIGSLKLTKTLSEEQKKRYSQIFTDSVIPIIEKYKGIPIKIIDDAILFYFPSSKDDKTILSSMLDCCSEISKLDKQLNDKTSSENLPGMAYRISTAFGMVNEAKTSDSSLDDIFGEPVNTCFKINQYALPNTVVVDDSVYQKAKDLQFKFTKLDQSLIKDLEYAVFILS
ncbi:adenylate/guanylate cyclase domain-containing protein [Nitrosopumilus sp. b3]|uniref:cache domain-containing protein n=1 Tax=Nitrosopumilus sp. b3 TaxID=2109909 RepID=UPI0015F369EC|nr:cache domain-containing protein [Nitrosopumilus sp. b3]KAF6246494.1 adenylate/guanylate cyclase domain-containing protein [Nitrosopumilus sp. b3]